MKTVKECINNGFSVQTDSFRVTMVFNTDLGTYAAAACLFNEETEEFDEPFVWGTINSEYPTLHPLPWLVCRYLGQHEWLTPELIKCLKTVGPDIANFVPGGHSALMDYLSKAVYEHRVVVVSKKSKRRFFARNEKEEAKTEDK